MSAPWMHLNDMCAAEGGIETGGDFLTARWAAFSPCRKWRYALAIIWDADLPPLIFFMLNPSTADAMKNDPTVTRCERRARALGFGGVVVINIFAFRATDPADMKKEADPVGPRNDEWIMAALRTAKITGGEVICAWGTHGHHMTRDTDCIALIFKTRMRPKILELTKHGFPKHPLYVAKAIDPVWWDEVAG